MHRALHIAIVSTFATSLVCAQEGGNPEDLAAFRLKLQMSSNRVLSDEPVFVRVSLQNEGAHAVVLREPFSLGYGDVTFSYCHDRPDAPWRLLRVERRAGFICEVRVPRPVEPDKAVDIYRWFVPDAILAGLDKEAKIQVRVEFAARGGKLLKSDAVPLTVVMTKDSLARDVESFLQRVSEGNVPKTALQRLRQNRANSPVSRAIDLHETFQPVREHAPGPEEETAGARFAERIAKLPPIERDFWAIHFASHHQECAGRVLNQRPLDEGRALFHLDEFDRIAKAAGNTSDNGMPLLGATQYYRDLIKFYKDRNRE